MQIDVKEAARLFNISEREMLRWVERRGVPSHQIQDNFMFNRSELADWAQANGVQFARPLAEAAGEALPKLADALKAGGIIRLEGGKGKEEALRDLVDSMPLPPRTDRNSLFKVLMAREMVSSTGIGEGIAIPHVKSPLILHTDEPLVNLCLLRQPVDFCAIDAKPVHALFTMISPNARLHLHLISRLALTLHDPAAKAALDKQAPDGDILSAIALAEDSMASRRG